MNGEANLPFIPETITVHLGAPSSGAPNVTVPFQDYIKNVASSEIYPTWSENALRANILAQISFALNRVYTEYYRSRGYDFDITNSPSIDQSYINGRDIFDNISRITDEIFTDYLRRPGSVEPLFALYCNGTTVTCDGLSQWGSEALGRAGRTPYEILTEYYGDDLTIVRDAPIAGPAESYPGVPLRLGSSGNDVRSIQVKLNRIRQNYPAIPKITLENGIFGRETENAVREFQRIFSLTQDGIVGRATWYRIGQIYAGVKSLSDLASEGIPIEDVTLIFPRELSIGDRGVGVTELQYLLSFISDFSPYVPKIAVDGIFGEKTREAVKDFQTYYGFDSDGVVSVPVWEKIVSVYRGLLSSVPGDYFNSLDVYFGAPLTIGDRGIYVQRVQDIINYLANFYPSIPKVSVDGIYGPATASAVRAFQRLRGISESGLVGATTYGDLAREYERLMEQSRVGAE